METLIDISLPPSYVVSYIDYRHDPQYSIQVTSTGRKISR